MDESGTKLGTHEGAYGFTIGQRKGLRISTPAPDGKPRYVLDISPVTNTVTVGPAAALDVTALTAIKPRWCGTAPTGPGTYTAQLRAHGGETEVTAEPVDGELRVTFAEPVRGVAPGQAIVLYDGTRVVGSATIASHHARDGVGLTPGPARLPGEELRQHRPQHVRLHHVGLARQDPVRALRHGLRDRLARPVHPLQAGAARDREHGHGDPGQPRAGQQAVAHHRVVVGEAGGDGLHARPHRGLAGALDHLLGEARQAQEQLHRVPAPALGERLVQLLPVDRLALGAVRQVVGVRHLVTPRPGAPAAPSAAARSTSAPPEETPNSAASPPTASSSAARSSTSRSTAYGAVSPLSPRPRRS